MKARTDLRRLLTADALTTVPAIGERAELDPIFKLIAAHKAAWAQFMELDAAPRKIGGHSRRYIIEAN
jgi:hypothetical protein